MGAFLSGPSLIDTNGNQHVALALSLAKLRIGPLGHGLKSTPPNEFMTLGNLRTIHLFRATFISNVRIALFWCPLDTNFLHLSQTKEHSSCSLGPLGRTTPVITASSSTPGLPTHNRQTNDWRFCPGLCSVP